jgi:hypothetical protein
MAVVAAAAVAAAVLHVVDLFAQAVQFLIGQLLVVFGLGNGLENAFHVAQNGFQGMADAIDLAAQGTINIAVAVITIVAAFAATVTPISRVAWTARLVAPRIGFTRAFDRTVAISIILAATHWRGPTFAFAFINRFPIGVRAFFGKFFSLRRIVNDRFGRAFLLVQRFGLFGSVLGRFGFRFIRIGARRRLAKFIRFGWTRRIFIAGRLVVTGAPPRRWWATSAAATATTATISIAAAGFAGAGGWVCSVGGLGSGVGG